ncbi:MAG: MGMT family protein [Candidatus Omnitrophica bacterium]|nr:MGMT family protein [Candidatus Omnitrophota bacterium]
MKNADDKIARLTEFERAVLAATLTIPFGETRSYAWVAGKIGCPKAVRAVGTALRKNPWPLIVPCHRVVRSDGSPGKYAGKDDGRKAELIRLERELAASILSNKP